MGFLSACWLAAGVLTPPATLTAGEGRIESITVYGNRKTADSVILRELEARVHEAVSDSMIVSDRS